MRTNELSCTTCKRHLIDIMCFCGECFLGHRGRCPGLPHKHSIEEAVLKRKVDLFMNSLYDLCDCKTPKPGAHISYIERYSAIQVLKANEALSALSGYGRLMTDDPYYAFTTTLIKRHKAEFTLDHVRFHYVFEASSDIYGFLNNYLALQPTAEAIKNSSNAGERLRVIRAVYKEAKVFRCKGIDVNEEEFSLLKRAHYVDHMSIFIQTNDETNVIMIDIASKKAHVICQKRELEAIVDLMKANKISLSKPTFKMFEGVLEVATHALLFKPFMTAYLNNEILASKFVVLGPDKSVNDYVFYESFHEADDGGTPTRKTHEYVKLTIEPIKKVDMIVNVFKISFQGNNKALLLPFIGAIMALVSKLENLQFSTGEGGYLPVENAFIRGIREGRFDVDRHVGSYCAFQMCKKGTFMGTLASFVQDEDILAKLSALSVNYRPLAVHRPYNRRLSGVSYLDGKALLQYACFYDSLEINLVFTKGAPQSFAERESLYVINVEVDNHDRPSKWDFFERSTGIKRKYPNQVIVITGESKIVIRNVNNTEVADIVLMCETSRLAFIDPLIEASIKGLKIEDDLPRRRSTKVHGDKLVPIDTYVNNVLMKYVDSEDGLHEVGTRKPPSPFKMTTFTIGLIREDYPIFKEYALELLGPQGVSVLLSQHLWDYTPEERLKLLDNVNVEIHQDLLQHIFDARIFYFVFDQKRNEYVFKQPRHNGWYAISDVYNRVMFVFKAKNENLITVFFECSELDNVGVYVAYSIPLTDKLNSTHDELISPIGRPHTTKRDPRANGADPRANGAGRVEVGVPVGQLIDSYGKSVGFVDKDGNQRRHAPSAPYMLPRQHVSIIERTFTVKRRYLVAKTNGEHFRGCHAYVEKNALRTNVLANIHKGNAQMQHFSVLFKVILKYVLIMSNVVRERTSDEIDTEELLNDVVIETDKEVDDSNLDAIYNILKLPTLPDEFVAFLTQNYSSIFRDGRFHVTNAPKTKLFLSRELALIKNSPPSFVTDFIGADLDIDLVRQQPNEIVSESYLLHQRKVVAIRERFLSHTAIVFQERLRSEVLVERRIVLVRISTETNDNEISPNESAVNESAVNESAVNESAVNESAVNESGVNESGELGRKEDYFLAVDTEKAEIETAFFVCEQWKNSRTIAEYAEERKLASAHEAYRLADGLIVCMSEPQENVPKVLYYEHERKNRYASLLPLA